MFDRKSYDRQHSKDNYTKYKQERALVLIQLGGRCVGCDCQDEKRLQLHHKYYDANSDYPRTSNGWSRIKRVREASKEPDKFHLLCGRCHKQIHAILSSPIKLLQLCGFNKL